MNYSGYYRYSTSVGRVWRFGASRQTGELLMHLQGLDGLTLNPKPFVART